MPDRSLSVRHLLDDALQRSGSSATIAVESGSIAFLRNYVQREHLVSFQISIGLPRRQDGLAVRVIDADDLPPMQVVLSQLRGRQLSNASTEFAKRMTRSLRASVRLADIS